MSLSLSLKSIGLDPEASSEAVSAICAQSGFQERWRQVRKNQSPRYDIFVPTMNTIGQLSLECEMSNLICRLCSFLLLHLSAVAMKL
jgi:RNase P subunit RPR2